MREETIYTKGQFLTGGNCPAFIAKSYRAR